jgi:ribonuclease P protein component
MDCHFGERFLKCMRLRKRMEFLDVQRRGRKVRCRAFVGLFVSRDAERTRIGITTTKRLGNAVKRNRVRRLVREAFRLGHFDPPKGVDLVVIAKKAACEMSTAAIFDDLAVMGRRARKLMERQP